ncbi:hypothetical protein K1X25_09135, partial [Campylobacter jejuni]
FKAWKEFKQEKKRFKGFIDKSWQTIKIGKKSFWKDYDLLNISKCKDIVVFYPLRDQIDNGLNQFQYWLLDLQYLCTPELVEMNFLDSICKKEIVLEISKDNNIWEEVPKELIYNLTETKLCIQMQETHEFRYIKISSINMLTKLIGLDVYVKKTPGYIVCAKPDAFGMRLAAILVGIYIAEKLNFNFAFVWNNSIDVDSLNVQNSQKNNQIHYLGNAMSDVKNIFAESFLDKYLIDSDCVEPSWGQNLGFHRRSLSELKLGEYDEHWGWYSTDILPSKWLQECNESECLKKLASIYKQLEFSDCFKNILLDVEQKISSINFEFIALHIRGGEIIFSDSRRLPGWEVVEDRYFPYEIAYELIIKELDNELKIVIFGQDLKANKILKQYFAKSNCVYTIDDFIDKDMQDVERTFFDVNFMSKAKKIYSARESVFSKCAMMISGTNNLISYHDIFRLEDQFDIIQKNVYKLNLHDLHKAMSYFRLYRISRILQMDIKKSLEFINQASVLDKDNDAYLIYTIDCYFEMKEYQKINDMLKNILLYRKDKFLRNMFDISRYSFDKEYQNYINFNSHSYPYINFMIAMVCAWLGYNEKSIIFNFYISSQNIDENLKQALKKFINTKIQEHLNVNNYLKAQLNYK